MWVCNIRDVSDIGWLAAMVFKTKCYIEPYKEEKRGYKAKGRKKR